MDTKWLNEDELQAWVRLIAVLEILPSQLDGQLRRDAGLTNFEYYVLAMLSEAPDRTLRMTDLAAQTNATQPRLSHVVTRLEARELVRRCSCPSDGRVTNAVLTDAGWNKLVESVPAHVANVRASVIDALSAEQVEQLSDIAEVILRRLDPDGKLTPMYRRHDAA